MASLANVSKSTLSKFARKIGFDDYYDLKDSAHFIENRYNNNLNYVTNILNVLENNEVDSYFDAIQSDIQTIKNEIDKEAIDSLAKDLINYRKIGAFGLLFSESAALDFQYKLAYNGKFIVTFQDDLKQEEFIRNADKDTLLIIFTNSGNFIRQQQLRPGTPKKNIFKHTKAKLIAITSDRSIKDLHYVDDVILFPHNTNIQTHAFLYQIVMDLVVAKFRHYILDESENK